MTDGREADRKRTDMEKADRKIPEQVRVKSLYKAMQILFYFGETDQELGVTQLAGMSGELKSTVHNILSTLEVCGLVERNPRTNRYRLGIKVLELSNRLYCSSDIRKVMGPLMSELAASSGENVYLASRAGTEAVYLDAVFPPGMVGGRNMVGISAPLYCTGIGKAILAHEPETVWEQVSGKGLVQYTDQTITDKQALWRELEQIRKQGFSVDNMEHEFGVKCVAVPILGFDGRVLAGISISGPSLRFPKERIEELARQLRQAAEAGRRI